MRGTMGGAPICLVGAVGFATVAIGSGPFVKSVSSERCLKIQVKGNFRYFMHSPPICATSLNRCRDTPANRNATARHFVEEEWRGLPRGARHKQDRGREAAHREPHVEREQNPRDQPSVEAATCWI
jgi:hypothetical protein